MSAARASVVRALASIALAAAALALLGAARAEAGEGGATWRLEQPPPPPPEPGVSGSSTAIGLGHIGDIEFIAPNRGLLITAGEGSTVKPGIWAYDGAGWKQLAIVCGATDGRIAWAAQNEFWTVSDGRPGQAGSQELNEKPPLQDNTLCHFAIPERPELTGSPPFEVVASYASIAFRTSSYQAMHAAGCLATSDCWFAGEPLPEGSSVSGSFHLRWNGSTLLEEPFEGEAQPVEDMRAFDGRLYESVRIKPPPTRTLLEPPVLHTINPAGASPTFEGIPGAADELESPYVPLYAPDEIREALGPLRLSASGDELWAAASVATKEVSNTEHAQVTVARLTSEQGEWRQLLGPLTTPSGEQEFPHQVLASIAAEPGGAGAWMALDSQAEAESGEQNPEALALVAHISASGAISEEQTLPSQSERERGVGAKGAAERLACPAAHDCWLTTTQGWLFHLTTGQESLPVDEEGFSSLIANRPADQGLPQVPPDAPPEESSGPAEAPATGAVTEKPSPLPETRVAVPLLTGLRSRLVHGSTLELRFHLAVKAQVRLIAKRHGATVASTPSRTLAGGNRKLLLRLNPRRWPTKLDLQTHALAALPSVPTRSPSVETLTTGLAFPKALVPPPAGSPF